MNIGPILKDSTRIIARIQDTWLISPMVSLVLTIDDFVLRVYSENGSADSKGYIGGSKWKCEARNDQTPIKKTCKWIGGDFNLE